MSKPLAAPQCLTPGCELPAAVNPSTGCYRRECVEHVPKAKTLRRQIAEGDCFIVDAAPHGPCINCGGFNEIRKEVDWATGLGPACHAIWRWSPVREREAA